MRSRHRRSAPALVATVALAAASLAGISAPAGAGAGAGGGGDLVWGLEAETAGGFCLPHARLAAAGIQVVNAIYDPLVTLNSKGEYVPYLVESFEPNATFDQWTIRVRPNVTFHNGQPFDAEALKLNIDTYRGQNPNVSAELFLFVFQDIDTVTVTDPSTVVVTTKRPWVAFDGAWASGRIGMVAPEQLQSNDFCNQNFIGTGPFRFVEFRQNELLKVERNPDYWRKGYPKADSITFRPVVEATSRVSQLVGGELDLVQIGGSTTLSIAELRERADAGEVKLLTSDKGAEVSYIMLNIAKPPFDDPIARQAVAYAGDARQVNEIRNKGLPRIATGPFGPENPAYLDREPIRRNLKKARRLAAEYEQKHGEPLSWEYVTNPDPELISIAELTKEQQEEAGIEVSIRTVDQARLINEILAGNFQGAGLRNHPGGDPDTQYVWWYSTSPVNFGRINDPAIDRLLDEGRSEPDPARRTEIYLELNERFATELYNLWTWYTLWGLGYQNDITGVKPPPLPDGGGKAVPLFAGIEPVLNIRRK